MAEENLILAVTDNPVIYDMSLSVRLSCEVYVMHPEYALRQIDQWTVSTSRLIYPPYIWADTPGDDPGF